MTRKKKEQQEEGYTSNSTVDNEPPEMDEDEEQECEGQQEMFEATEPEDKPSERKEDLVVTIQIGAAKITAIKAKEVPTATIPELIIKRLIASRHLRKMICAILDLPPESEARAYEYTEACGLAVAKLNEVRQKEYEAAKKKREDDEKAEKARREKEERRKNFRTVKPEPRQEAEEPPTYDEQNEADGITVDGDPENF